jgi:hypothetical protein
MAAARAEFPNCRKGECSFVPDLRRALGTKKLCRNSRIEQGFNLQPTPAKGRRSNRRSIAVFVAPLVITNRASAAKDIE